MTRVALIEDNVGFAYYIRDLLMRRHHGRFTIEEAHSLADGLAILRRGCIDIVLLDLGLPDSVRIETFEKVYAAAPYTPIIILTVLDDDDVARKAMRADAQDYLVKDQVDGHTLLRSIRYAIERARSRKALHDLSARILQLQDEERRHIARELHDTTAQNLAALMMNLALLQSQAPAADSKVQAALEDSLACADRCIRELRTMSYLLHPPLLDEVGLAAAAREYADGFATRSGLRVDLELPPGLGRMSKATETTLFRIMQESLTNILRHSGSPSASIHFTLANAHIQLQVRDAGRGIPPDRLAAGSGEIAGIGVGVRGMFERVRQLRGSMEIQTGFGGTTVQVQLPLTESSV